MQAPDFTLNGTKPVSLKDLKGKPTILVFYPQNETPVCTTQLSLYNEVLPMFKRFDAEIFGISVDSVSSHVKFQERLNLRFDLLSDASGEVAKSFDVFNENTKKCKRALFVLDGENNIFWSEISPDHINPGANGILEALEKLNN